MWMNMGSCWAESSKTIGWPVTSASEMQNEVTLWGAALEGVGKQEIGDGGGGRRGGYRKSAASNQECWRGWTRDCAGLKAAKRLADLSLQPLRFKIKSPCEGQLWKGWGDRRWKGKGGVWERGCTALFLCKWANKNSKCSNNPYLLDLHICSNPPYIKSIIKEVLTTSLNFLLWPMNECQGHFKLLISMVITGIQSLKW